MHLEIAVQLEAGQVARDVATTEVKLKRVFMTIATVVVATCGAQALAQPAVFFDDFDGNALLPHWNQPPPSYWEYDVSESMLNVTGLFNPSHPKSPSNFASMNAPFTPQSDFRADVWMGWESGDAPHRLEFRILGPFSANPILASMGYRNEGSGPLIYAQPGDAPPLSVPVPSPGIHHFTIARTDDQFNFYLNGNHIASFEDNWAIPAAYVGIFFLGPYPGDFGAFHIDRVQIVPSPGPLVLLIVLPFATTCRRR